MICRTIKSAADLRAFSGEIGRFDLMGKTWVGTLKEYRKPKSLGQLKLYFLWLNCISDIEKVEVKTLDIYFKDKYLGREVIVFRGKEIEVPVSKSDLDSKQMYYFLESVRLEAIEEMDITLPMPEDQGWNDFCERYFLK